MGDEAAVVVDEHTELGDDGLALGTAQSGAVGEVHHPGVIGRGGFKGFLRAAVEPLSSRSARRVRLS